MIYAAVVSDSGPLISFEKIPDGFRLMSRLVGQVLIPPQVLDEVTEGLRPGRNYLDHFGLREVGRVAVPSEPPPATEWLHAGERYAITLALGRDFRCWWRTEMPAALPKPLG